MMKFFFTINPKLSDSDALVHSQAVMKYLEQDIENSPIDKTKLRNLHCNIG